MMRANLLYADGKIYANEVNGRGYILKPTPTGADILYKFRYPSGEECYGSPIAANGRIYIPTTGKMYCIGKADHSGESKPAENVLSGEAPAAMDEQPALVQLVPVESLLRPGIQQKLHARLYNSKGQYLRNAKADQVKFQVDGAGTVDEGGQYVIPSSENRHTAAALSATVENITGKARVRIVPDLNWSFNFDDGKIPVTWVGCAYRHAVMDWDLLSKLRKEDPMTGDLYIYMMTEFANFGPKRDFDDSTPQQRWKNLLVFLDLAEGAEKPKTVDEAKAKFDKSLQKLVEEKVLKEFTWSTWDRKTGNKEETVPEVKLSVSQGERKIDGNGVLCKLTTIPKGTRSQGWMGQPDLHDYTIQADMLCFSRQNKMPDAGLIAQRYTCDLMGAAQQVQIRTWTPQLNRFSAETPLKWEPEVWYTVKFRAENGEGKAVLRGKIWKKGAEEPKEWTVTVEDPAPNTKGSPGLFGNTKDGEFFYDNLTVTRNAK
jgi:hypothetical protein